MILALLLAGLAATPAGAATATLVYEETGSESTYVLSVTDGSGQPNRLAVLGDPDGFSVSDSATNLAAGPGCDVVSASEVRCPMPQVASRTAVFVAAGGGADRIVLGDLVEGTTTEARGGDGRDLIFGSESDDLLLGEDGNDGIAAGPGTDRLDGGPGDDTMTGGPDDARDTVLGRNGDDLLIGYRASGGPGRDSLDAQIPDCGSGTDVVLRRQFRTPGPFERACETVHAEFVAVTSAPLDRSRTAVVYGVRCNSGPCRGRLELRDGRGRLGRAGFSMRQSGKLTRVRVPLGRKPASRVATLRISGDAQARDSFLSRLR